mgnify:CR=1 FL=1
MKRLFESWNRFIEEVEDRESLTKSGMEMEGCLNCKLFVQELTGVSKIKDLPSKPFKFEDLKTGDIIAWFNGLHYAVYLGGGEIIHVEEWGSKPEVASLQDSIEEHDEPEFIYTPKR